MNIKARFINFLGQRYPYWSTPEGQRQLEVSISDQLLSEKIIELPRRVLGDIKNEISQYHQLRAWGATNLSDDYKRYGLRIPPNESVCTSYDFHVTSERELKLIEINTNASFLALGTDLYRMHEEEGSLRAAAAGLGAAGLGAAGELPDFANFNPAQLAQMFRDESGEDPSGPPLQKVVITDDDPPTQRLYIEFLHYQQIFSQFNLRSEIVDFRKLDPGYLKKDANNFVYNRYTDFYLADEKSKTIKKLFNAGEIILSPNPYEYFLLADKQRMFDWQNQTDIAVPKSLLKIYDLGVSPREFIWAERRKLFFKPKNSFGSKLAYKGASISHRLFDEFYGPTMLAQEFAAPDEVEVDVVKDELSQKIKMKYDLRCYAYRGKLQIVIARLYQGQTTNLRTDGGGFTVVRFV